jgi:hypothetical protein
VLGSIENVEGAAINVAPGSGHRVRIPLPADSVGAFLARYVTTSADPASEVTAAADCMSGGCAGCG